MFFPYPPVINFKDYKDDKGLISAKNALSPETSTPVKDCPLKKKEEPLVVVKAALTELILNIGDNSSKSYVSNKHDKVTSDAADRFCMAPREETAKIKWKIENAAEASSGRLALYYRGHTNPIWSKKLESDELQKGELDWSGEVSKISVKFTSGFIHVGFSPYKMILVINGNVEEKKDKAWTYCDVLVEEIALTWGTYDMLDRERPDIDAIYHDRILGPAADKSEKGYEETVLDELKGDNAQPSAGAKHKVILTSNLFAKKAAGDMTVAEYVDNTDYLEYKKLWGHGARIPIIATVKIKKSNNEISEDCFEALAGSQLLWDWRDKDLERWKEELQPTAKTEDYLRALFIEHKSNQPHEAANCPVELGGKLGSPTSKANELVFLTSDENSKAPVNPGNFPVKVEACSQRSWGVRSHFRKIGSKKEKCSSAVIFNPSRIAGDRYKLRCSLYFDPGQNSGDELEFPAKATAEAGSFEIFRRVTLNYLVRGATADLGVDPAAVEEKIKDIYLRELKMVVDVKRIPIDNDAYKKALRDGVANSELVSSAYGQFPSYPLIARNIVDFDPPANSPAVQLKDRDDVLAGIESMIQPGKLRLLTFGKPKAPAGQNAGPGMSAGEKIVGQSSGATGYPILTGSLSDVTSQYVLLEGDAEFQDGEKIEGAASKDKFDVKANPAKSCWGHQIVEVVNADDDTYKSVISVDIAGQQTVKVKYGRTGFKRSIMVVPKQKSLTALKNSLALVAAGWDESTELTITLTHKGKDDDNHKLRVSNLKQTLLGLLTDKTQAVFIDRKRVWDTFEDSWSLINGKDSYFSGVLMKNLAVNCMIPAIVEAYVAENHPNDEGIFLLHIPGRTNARSLSIYGEKFKELQVAGAFYGESFPGVRNKTTTYVATVDPNGPRMFEEECKSVDSIFAHEVAHAIYMPHAPMNTPNSPFPSNAEEGCHVKNDNCLMNYDVDSEHFCAICMLRMRGWDWTPGVVRGKEQEYEVSLELDDVDQLFSASGDTRQGQIERLQYMGLCHRPMGHPELDDCYTFSKQHAETLFLSLNGADAAGQKTFFNQAIKDYMIDGGVLPTTGNFAKIRCPGGYSVMYSQNYLEAKFDESEQGKPAAKPFEDYMLTASRYDSEQTFLKGNPSIGKIPLKVTVHRRPKGTAGRDWTGTEQARGAWVYFEIITPDDISTAPVINEVELLAGGRCSYNSVMAPDLKSAPKKYFSDKVGGFKPAGASDPDANNVHKDIGGKRGGSVFCNGLDKNFSPIKYSKEFKFAAKVKADDHGVARIVFDPSLIGGDSYRLRVFVGPPTQDISDADLSAGGDGIYESGTMVRWRTLRVCQNLGIEPAIAKAEIAANVGKKTNGELMPEIDKLITSAPQIGVDLPGTLTTEMAKSYCQLIIEPDAQQFRSVKLFRKQIKAEALRLAQEYPRFNSTIAANLSIFRETMTAQQGDKDFRITLQAKPVPGSVTVRPTGEGKSSAIMSDENGPTEVTDKGNAVGISGEEITHASRSVSVQFETAQTGKSFDVCYHVDEMIDIGKILEWPDKSPFLFNLALPRVYNSGLAPGVFKADSDPKDETKIPKIFHSYIDARTLGFCKALMLNATVRGIKENKGFYPGLLFFRASKIDNYTAIWPTGVQEGKGVENGIFLFDIAGVTTQAAFDALSLHEMSHGLFLEHAPTVTNSKPHLHDPQDTCVMSYDNNDGDHCGQCVAALRGINTRTAAFE